MLHHLYHKVNTVLAISPIIWIIPTDSISNKKIRTIMTSYIKPLTGSMLGTFIAYHSHHSLISVSTDYVPKISRSILKPVNGFICVIGIMNFAAIQTLNYKVNVVNR